ncbi:MAG: hypothetical protein HUU01_02240 [Saprospiraceae bacterium]|nr:hypothetical protein [Saprospiraceae bacterium]
MKTISLAVFCALLFAGCRNSSIPEFEEQASQLEQRIRKAVCDKAGMQRQIDSVWAIAVTAMDQEVPKDLEPGTRANFLSLKAEHLIKMLPEYKPLTPETKQLITQAASLDSVVTLQFGVLLKEFNAWETEMKNFLQRVEAKAPELRIKYLNRLQMAQNEPCPVR